MHESIVPVTKVVNLSSKASRLKMQRPDHRKAPSQELKVFTMYEGWDAEAEKAKRSTLVNKAMLAGMEDAGTFQEKREAFIRSRYNADEIQQRILNGDGGSWIKEDYDPDAIFQLDRYHVYQDILRKIRDKEAQREIRSLFDEGRIPELFDYIRTYADSVESNDPEDKASQKARELYRYLKNNEEGLLPYYKRGISIPQPQEGMIHKEMGVQENRELIETIDRYSDGLITNACLEEIVETLSAAKAPKKDGKGNPYPDIFRAHMPLFDAVQTASRKAFLKAFSN